MSMSKILVAMNDAKITDYYAEMLERNGYPNEIISSVSDAEKRLDKESFNAVLTDFSSQGKQLLESVVLQEGPLQGGEITVAQTLHRRECVYSLPFKA